jgi:hypothetical protein
MAHPQRHGAGHRCAQPARFRIYSWSTPIGSGYAKYNMPPKFLYINSYLLLMERPAKRTGEWWGEGSGMSCLLPQQGGGGGCRYPQLTLPPGHPAPSPGGIRAYCTTCLLRVGQQSRWFGRCTSFRTRGEASATARRPVRPPQRSGERTGSDVSLRERNQTSTE